MADPSSGGGSEPCPLYSHHVVATPPPLGLAMDTSKLNPCFPVGCHLEAGQSPRCEAAQVELVADELPQREVFAMSLLGRAECRAGRSQTRHTEQNTSHATEY